MLVSLALCLLIIIIIIIIIDRFKHNFHWHTLWTICNNVLVNYFTKFDCKLSTECDSERIFKIGHHLARMWTKVQWHVCYGWPCGGCCCRLAACVQVLFDVAESDRSRALYWCDVHYELGHCTGHYGRHCRTLLLSALSQTRYYNEVVVFFPLFSVRLVHKLERVCPNYSLFGLVWFGSTCSNNLIPRPISAWSMVFFSTAEIPGSDWHGLFW